MKITGYKKNKKKIKWGHTADIDEFLKIPENLTHCFRKPSSRALISEWLLYYLAVSTIVTYIY